MLFSYYNWNVFINGKKNTFLINLFKYARYNKLSEDFDIVAITLFIILFYGFHKKVIKTTKIIMN